VAKILIIDDDPDFVEATRMVLEKAKHSVISASSGKVGVKRVKADKPDLVILDVIMDTALEGLSVSQAMHDSPELRDLPILMVSSIASSQYAGMFPTDEYVHVSAFLSKPVSSAELLRQVDRAMGKKK
jgi:CheY-like chemotaxis protein